MSPRRAATARARRAKNPEKARAQWRAYYQRNARELYLRKKLKDAGIVLSTKMLGKSKQ